MYKLKATIISENINGYGLDIPLLGLREAIKEIKGPEELKEVIISINYG